MTIVLGWWLLPAIVTLVSFAMAVRSMSSYSEFSDMPLFILGLFADFIEAALYLGAATIVSLISWTIYFALT